MEKIDLTGKEYGIWLVIREDGIDSKGNKMYLCKCKCGVEKKVAKRSLLVGGSRSCGCIRSGVNRIKSGLSRLPIYKVWQEMVRRCDNPNDANYQRYGGRGIKVYEEWKKPDIFISWANSNGYKKGLSIDRIDNNGNYTEDNCKWSTKKEQARNTKSNVNITYEGETKTLAEWAEKNELHYWTLKRRYHRGDTGDYLFRKQGAK